jgi:hypothetical protein
MIEKGDIVSVIDQDLNGLVLTVSNSGLITIRCKDGMDWEFRPNELVVTKAANPKMEIPKPTLKRVIEKKPEPVINYQEHERLPDLALAFLEQNRESWELQLCNHSGYHALCSVSQKK